MQFTSSNHCGSTIKYIIDEMHHSPHVGPDLIPHSIRREKLVIHVTKRIWNPLIHDNTDTNTLYITLRSVWSTQYDRVVCHRNVGQAGMEHVATNLNSSSSSCSVRCVNHGLRLERHERGLRRRRYRSLSVEWYASRLSLWRWKWQWGWDDRALTKCRTTGG